MYRILYDTFYIVVIFHKIKNLNFINKEQEVKCLIREIV